MKIKSEDIKTEYLYDTSVENIFLNEYMPMAPENYVKVYLLAKMYMNSGHEIGEETLAKTLHIKVEEVKKALFYWSKQGALRLGEDSIEFISMKEKLYGRPQKKKQPIAAEKGADILENDRIRQLIKTLSPVLGEGLTGTGVQHLFWWAEELKATDAVIEEAVKYCVSRGKTNMKYIGKLVQSWTEYGLQSRDDVDQYLEEADQRHYQYRRIMKALGFHRSATEKECQIIDSWFDDLDCSMREVLEACGKTSGISNPNINYVNSVLRGSRGKKTGEDSSGEVAAGVVRRYYQYLQHEAEEAAKNRRRIMLKRAPKLQRIEEAMLEANQELTQVMISGGANKQQRMQQIKEQMEQLEKDRDRIMAEHDIPTGYDNIQYKCSICGDTGVQDNGARCQCWQKRSQEASLWYQQQKVRQKD